MKNATYLREEEIKQHEGNSRSAQGNCEGENGCSDRQG